MTVINNPSPSSDNNSSSMVIGIIMLVLVLLFVFYGLPMITAKSGSSVNLNPPAQQGNPVNNIQVPDKIDVNLNSGQSPW